MKQIINIDQFADAWVLVLLLFIPIYLYWYFKHYAKQRLVVKLSYNATQLQKPNPALIWLRYLPMLFQLLGMASLIFALARPQNAADIRERNTEGIDIMLLLDVSGSMDATDFPPDRLTVAKNNAIEFIKGREGDKIGIVLFGEDAFSYAPLTLDYNWLEKLIKDINSGTLPKQGTAIGSAISVGINRIRETKNPSKVMILFTDGANNRGEIDPITASKLAKLYNIKIHTIGLGSPDFVAKEQNASAGIDESTLQRIANNTGGQFFRAKDPQSLKNVFKEISNMEKTDIHEDVYRDVTDLYPFFVKMGIIFFLIAFLLMITFIYNPLEQ